MLATRTWVAGLALLVACGGKAVVDEPLGAGGSGATTTTTTATGGGCPAGLVTDGTPCSSQGLVCPGEGSDPYCWDWTCSCQSGAFKCEPGVCS